MQGAWGLLTGHSRFKVAAIVCQAMTAIETWQRESVEKQGRLISSCIQTGM